MVVFVGDACSHFQIQSDLLEKSYGNATVPVQGTSPIASFKLNLY